MSNYTMTIYEILENPWTPLFNFSYPFYTDNQEVKRLFEEKFINHYYTHEIGFETFTRFEQALKSKLMLIMPYYQQLYESELKAKKIDFLLNKDLEEEFTRELTGTQNTNDTSITQSNQSENVKGSTLSKSSAVNDGVSSAKLQDGYLTNVLGDDTSSTGSTSVNGSAQVTGNRDNRELEKTRFISKGNIGVTSSAELLEKWRSVMINIDQLIIEECRTLFMMVY